MDSLLEAVTIVLNQNNDEDSTTSETMHSQLKPNSFSRSVPAESLLAPRVHCAPRRACHRCGNLRTNMKLCPQPLCPHVYCHRCIEKVIELFGAEMFENGCPVCKKLCCCGNKSPFCSSTFHCYRKCPVSRAESQKRAVHYSYPYTKAGYCVVGDRPDMT